MSVADCLKKISDGIKNINSSEAFDEGAAAAAKVKGLHKLATNPSFLRRFDSYIRNAYLSALPTHINNNLDNLTRVTLNIPLTPIRALMDKNVKVSDTLHMATGWAKGFAKAGPRFWKNLSETLDVGGVGLADVDIANQTWHSSKVADNLWLNRIATLPTALSRAFDDGAKAVLESMAHEVAISRLVNDPRVVKFAQKNNIPRAEWDKELGSVLQGDPSKFAMLEKFSDIGKYKAEAKLWADMNTLNSPLGNSTLDKLAKNVESLRESIPGSSIWLPFIKVPYLAAKEAATYVPGVGELRSIRAKKDAIKATEALAEAKTKVTETKRKILQLNKASSFTEDPAMNALNLGNAESRLAKLQDQVVKLEAAKSYYEGLPSRFRAQQIVGAGIAASTYSMAYNGYITGHFEDPGLRERMQAAGIPPMSVKIGDRWVSYEKLEPFSTIMGMVADYAEHEKSMLKEGKALLSADSVKKFPKIISENILNKTFTEPLSQILRGLQDPERYGTPLISSLGAVVPAGVAQVARIQDPVQRATKGENIVEELGNIVQSRIPANPMNIPSKEQLPPKVDILGKPKSTGSLTENIVGKGPVAGAAETALGLQAPQQTPAQKLLDNPYLTVSGMTAKMNGIELTQSELALLNSQAGGIVNNLLMELGSNRAFTSAPRPLQAKIINKLFEDSRKIAKLSNMNMVFSSEERRENFIKGILKKSGALPDTAPAERE